MKPIRSRVDADHALRSQTGAYFAPGTPAMLALESMMDSVGVRNVLHALAHLCARQAGAAAALDSPERLKSWRLRESLLESLARDVSAD